MTNVRDQQLLRSAVSDTAADLLSFLPSLGTGEVFAFGEGVAVPTRFQFKKLSASELPRSETPSRSSEWGSTDEARLSLTEVVERWRGIVREPRPMQERDADSLSTLAESALSSTLARTRSSA
jgi:DNA helicase HerA-like ATPase